MIHRMLPVGNGNETPKKRNLIAGAYYWISVANTNKYVTVYNMIPNEEVIISATITDWFIDAESYPNDILFDGVEILEVLENKIFPTKYTFMNTYYTGDYQYWNREVTIKARVTANYVTAGCVTPHHGGATIAIYNEE